MGQELIRILVVEDELSHANAITRCLLSSGADYQVVIADSLHQCRQQIVTFCPDILLLDLNLPDGQAISYLKEDSTERTGPVLIMTAQGSEELAVEALKAGALDYIVKTPETFIAMPHIVERSLREFRAQKEHRETQLALQESEERFRTLLRDIASVAVQGYHADGTVFYWNKASEHLYGYTSEEAMGQHLCDLIIPEGMRSEVYSAIREMMEAGEPIPSAELSLRHKNGAEVVVYSSHAVTRLPDKVPELYCIDIDISERKRSEQALQHQLRLQRILMEMSSVYINLPLDEVDAAIQRSLQDLGEFVETDRAYIFAYDFSNGTTSTTYEWCNKDISPHLYELQNIPISAIPDWLEAHKHGVNLYIADVSALPSDSVRKILESQQIKSLLAVPMTSGNECIGFVGFCSVRCQRNYEEPEQHLLGLFARMLVNVHLRRRAEVELNKLSFAVQQSPVSVVITDLDGNIEYVNPKFVETTGYTAEDDARENLRLLHSDSMSTKEYEELWQTITEGDEWSGEFLNKRKDGRLFWEKVLISPLRNAQGVATHYIGIMEDITVQKNYEQQLEYQATHDQLTGLTNRFLLKDRLEQAIQYAQRSARLVALVLLDLNRFKLINDSLGHAVGDDLLCQVAVRLKNSVRDTDTVARFGGDEFVILLTQIAKVEDIHVIIGKITQAFSAPYKLGERLITLSASTGVSLFPHNSEDSATLIRYADMAMYQAKNSGQVCCFYSKEIEGFGVDVLELENDMYQAIDLKQLRLYYQPKINLETGLIDGCEALLRWEHPQRGMIPPGEFIPIAEQTGLIVSIGKWVMEEACRQNLTWQAEGLPPLRIAVNLSARQFRQATLATMVKEVLQDAGLNPELLELELTESMIMDDPEKTSKTLQGLKDIGVLLSLDDFGTGFSSLNYLRRFPFDSLKIDQSFIYDVITDPSGASVVASIIDIAHNLNLVAIAEGVETPEQLDFLVANKCDVVQGFLFSKPLPADEFIALLKQQRRWPVDKIPAPPKLLKNSIPYPSCGDS